MKNRKEKRRNNKFDDEQSRGFRYMPVIIAPVMFIKRQMLRIIHMK